MSVTAGGSRLVAQSGFAPQSGTLQSLSFYVDVAAGALRLSLYDATGPFGGPGTKLVDVAEFAPVLGWNTRALPSPVTLSAGRYWLAFAASSDQLRARRDDGGTARSVAQSYGVMPTTFPPAPTASAERWSFYATMAVPVNGAPNAAPTVQTPASAPAGAVVGVSTGLSARGADDGGEAALTYHWTALAGAAGTVTFSDSGTNSAKAVTATFSRAGSYPLQLTVSDPQGLTATSTVTVQVVQTPTTIAVAPASVSLIAESVQQFSAQAQDQFGQPISPSPNYLWTTSDGGTINPSGLFTAGVVAGGPFTVRATLGNATGIASVTVAAAPNGAPIIVAPASAVLGSSPTTTASLSVSVDDDAGEAGLSYEWTTLGSPPGVVVFSSNMNNSAKQTLATFSRGGSYVFGVTATDAQGLTASSTVSVVVEVNATMLSVAPETSNVLVGGTQMFEVQAMDQFSQPIASPPTVTWSVSGGGNVNGAGVFTAGATPGGPFTVSATSASLVATASVTVLSVPNVAPSIASAASATLGTSPTTTATLSVLGADDAGESGLTYTWTAVGSPPAAVLFDENGNNAAKITRAFFTRAGSYPITVTVVDAQGLEVTSTTTVIVEPTVASIALTPQVVSVPANSSQLFVAIAQDQFTEDVVPNPTITWMTSGGGSVDATGLFTAGAVAGGPHSVTAAVGAVSASAMVTVTALSNQSPTIATGATASLGTAPATTAALDVLGADDAGESSLTYSWTTLGAPPGAVTYSINGSNSAKSTTVAFTRAGSYEFQVTVTDAAGLTATSTVGVIVPAEVSTISLMPSSVTVAAGGSQTFTATVTDQFALSVVPTPSIVWAVSGGGSISPAGVFTAANAGGGPFTVTATSAAVVGNAIVTVNAPVNQPPTVASPVSAPSSPVTTTTASLSVLGADDGGAAALTYTWSTTGAVAAPVTFSPNGTNAASTTTAMFTASGTYGLQVTIRDADGLTVTSNTELTVAFPISGVISGLDFPGNAAVATTMRFKFIDPHLNGLPIYGPGGNGVTYIWRAYPRRQSGYYTTFFWGNDDGSENLNAFYWRNGSPDSYYGAHPYPRGGSNSTVHDWEISTDEADFVNGAVEYDRWHIQALRVWSDASGKHYEFYTDLPNTDAAHRVIRNSPTSYGNVNPPAPALTFGDAPWRPGEEVWNGILRGLQIYAGPLTLAEILNEINAPLSTAAGAASIWYLNMDPTPSDISDKSGKGHNPVWVGAERPSLFTGAVSAPLRSPR